MPIRAFFVFLPLLLSGSDPAVAAATGERLEASFTSRVRAAIEPELGEASGHGFASFVCDLRRGVKPGRFVDCETVDRRKRPARYTLAIDEKLEVTVYQISYPPSRLAPEVLARHEAPCREFLEACGRADSGAALAALHSSLRDAASADRVRATCGSLPGILGSFGSVALRETAFRPPDHLELSFDVSARKGPGLARFRVALDETKSGITAFSIGATPGSPLWAANLEEDLRRRLSNTLGEPVSRVDAPVEELGGVGDAVTGTARTASGLGLAVWIGQTGRTDDFEPGSYEFKVLHAPFVAGALLAGRSIDARTVTCPRELLPDGEFQLCTAELRDGGRLSVGIRRKGADHVLESMDPARE